MVTSDNLIKFYDNARNLVLTEGFGPERDWQQSCDPTSYSETVFLREAAWVILCSGFREAYVRTIFDSYSLAFCDWESAGEIVNAGAVCVDVACQVFGNKRKAQAIFNIAETVAELGFTEVQKLVSDNPTKYLEKLPMLGSITAKHLAKNLGFPIAKDDRHLVRIAAEQGYGCVNALCLQISDLVGESVQVVDITLWRYGVLRTGNHKS